MHQLSPKNKRAEEPKLTLIEQQEITQRIEVEKFETIRSMAKLGAFANVLGAFLYIVVINTPTFPRLTIYWYMVLILANVVNLFWSKQCAFVYTEQHKKRLFCRIGVLTIIGFICLTWGSIGILFLSNNIHPTIIFLSAVLICFSFSTAIDLTIAIISIFCLLTPTIIYFLYLSIQQYYYLGEVSVFGMSIATAFSVLGIFMLVACYIGNQMIVNFIRLNYENDLLRQKLENMNNLLEQKVKLRTKELEKSLQLVTYQATHDLMTELPNERLLYDRIKEETEKAIRNHYKFAIACMSLNDLSKINRSLGSEKRNLIIKRISQRFADFINQKTNHFIGLARQDIFVFIIEHPHDMAHLESHIKSFFKVLKEPIAINKLELNITGSIGVSIFPDHGRDVNTLIANAEAARLLASEEGGDSIRIYDIIINADATRQLKIDNLLYHVIENNELVVHFQPFLDLKSKKICGVEALVRWDSPELGLVPPLDFILTAEANGMIFPIGEWVAQETCRIAKEWQKKGLTNLVYAINLSAKQLMQANYAKHIEETLHKEELNPSSIELELTESKAFHSETIPIINQLVNLGISISIDDFGTGYSEFSTLKLFNVNKIKIDKSFIQDIRESIDSKNIVLNTIALAKSMKIKCVAEGVETKDQLQFLERHGCDFIQGYYVCKPLEEQACFEFIKRYNGL